MDFDRNGDRPAVLNHMGALSLLVVFRTVFEEIVVQGLAELEKQLCVDRIAPEELVHVLAGAVDLLRQPCYLAPLLV